MNKINPNDLKNGDLLLCRGTSWIAKGIRLFTGSKITHVAVVVKHSDDSIFIVDAQKDGVFPRTPEAWQRTYNYEFKVYRSRDVIDDESFIKRATSQYGTPYDKELLLREFPNEILKAKINKTRMTIDGKFEGNGKFVCSEFAMWCYCVKEAHSYTPADVEELCSMNIKFRFINEGRF